ncbi:hypothetical protein FEM48_Zijuj06G0188800 [Ziziphus jujuba var. spinosa]|uniref:F-box domain-containing protein n=1 Tax=Ziziphus jujuba var. spinosa TaxID=714518 RepID=A0A978VB11_ZIZJJ|nr:hypothetical protein FEM48_Zijuj06G0188800 [Ziziphus jujuba var. spinosa]
MVNKRPTVQMVNKRLEGWRTSVQRLQPNKYTSKRLMLKLKKRLKGRIFFVEPNKCILERLMLKGKKWRLKEEEDKEDMMIGKLPDEILESLMYRLTTKEAARMSVLSQQWKRIWKTTIQITPSLTFDFDDGPLVDEEELMTKKKANKKINVACPQEISDTFPFPQFSKVEHLELEMVLGSTIPIHHFPDVLTAVPFLNTFTFEFYNTGHPGASNGLKWLDEYIPEKVEVNGHSCQYVKVMKLNNFGGCKNEVEFLLHLLKNIVLVENIIIQLVPSSLWIERGYWYNHEDEFDNQYEKLCVGCAQQLKTKIL